MFRIAICEDDVAQRAYEETLVRSWVQENEYKAVVDVYASAEQFLFAAEDMPEYDLLILDIQMGGMNGMELAGKLRENGGEMAIIFLTGVPDYAMEGYEVGAVRYLLKPLKEKEFYDLLNNLFKKLEQESEAYYIWEQGMNVSRIAFCDIVYVEARGHYLYMSTVKGEQEWKCSFSSLEEEFRGRSFCLLRRGLLVNLEHVESINRLECVLDQGKTLPVARGRYQELNKAFIAYYRGKADKYLE